MIQRYRLLLTSLILCFFIIITRFFYWQVIKSSDLKEKALSQTYKLETQNPSRGQILSSDNFPLALNQTNYQISIYKPNLKQDLDSLFQKIDSVHPGFISENQKNIDNFKNNPKQLWIDLPTLFTNSEKTQFQDTPGITIRQNQNRYYPENKLAKDILGFIAKDEEGNQIGYGGLENYYNKKLRGKIGFILAPQDATGKTILTKKSWTSPSTDGQNIHTSINRSIQYQAEKILSEGIERYKADSGSITVIESQTGQVLAMTSLVATSSATPSASKNPAIADLFEPGSIFKPIVVSMALDQKSIGQDYICEKCGSPRTIGEYTITNWDSATHPNATIKDIILNSDNIGMSYIISKLGLDNFLRYYQKLGLNQRTGIDLQGESKPTVKNNWPEIDLATASFGQGIVVTQVNMLQAFNTIANNGQLIKPKVAQYFTNNLDQKFYPKKQDPVSVFHPETVSYIKEVLKYAVENGVVNQFRPKNLEVCAKSGTAQVAVKGSYTDSSTIASYIGFSPCNNPKFTMIVTINNPKSSPWGSSTAAPIWFELASKIDHLL
jgi:cell division protein FtsI/penicillin-binding protein 2